MHRGEGASRFNEPFAREGLRQTWCEEVVAGPFVSPDLSKVGYVARRRDDHVFVVDGEQVFTFKDPRYVSLGLDGTGMFYVLRVRWRDPCGRWV